MTRIFSNSANCRRRPFRIELLEDRRLLTGVPELLKDIIIGRDGSTPEEFVEAGEFVYFRAYDGIHGEELWKTDGTPEGTVLVKDVFTGSASSKPQHLTNVNGTLYFRAHDGIHGASLWKSDGTADGTVLVKDTAAGSGYTGPLPDHLTEFNGTLYFGGHEGGHKIWKSDGTPGGTVMVSDVIADYSDDTNRWLVLNNQMYFSGNDGIHGRELWKTDGTPNGTVLVRDIQPNNAPISGPKYLTNVGGIVYFSANDGVHGEELWRSDGTADGTFLVKDINPGIGFSEPVHLTSVGDTLYFRAHDGIHGWELWKSDGTAPGTVMVKDIRPGSAFSEPEFLTDVNGTLYFRANDGVHGNELWKSDGSADGTVMVIDITAGEASSFPNRLINVNGTLYFSKNGIWKTDGTADGTAMVSNVRLDFGPDMTNINRVLYFSADDPEVGREPWILRVPDENRALTNDASTLDEDTTDNIIDVLANDSAPTGHTLTVVAITQPKNGIATVGTGGVNVAYTPNPDFFGTDTFTYTVTDSSGVTDTATVTVTVTNTPDPPDARNDLTIIAENSKNKVIEVLANDLDPDGGTLTVIDVTQASNGTVNIGTNGSNIVYTPHASFSGSDIFRYTIADAEGNTDTATVLVDVSGGFGITGTEGDDVFYVRLDMAGNATLVFNNAIGTGNPIFTAPRNSITPLPFYTLGGNDRLIVDTANGDPLPLASMTYDGGAGIDTFEVRDNGTRSGELKPSESLAGASLVAFAGKIVALTNVEPIEIRHASAFQVITPNANDSLVLKNTAADAAQLGGISGAIAIGPVIVQDVGTFIVDAAANDSGNGNDSLIIDSSGDVPTNGGFVEYRSGTGLNTLFIQSGSAHVDATVEEDGSLNTTVAAGAELITHRLRQNALVLASNAKAAILPAATNTGASLITTLQIGADSTLDITNNVLVIDDLDGSSAATVRKMLLTGRGGAGFGATWTGSGITSSTAAQANLSEPGSWSVGYAENGALPLGSYETFRGVAVDATAVLIAYTRTGDANLDGVVNDDDVAIVGAAYAPGVPQPNWALGDFDYNGFVDDDDVTLLGVFYQPGAAAAAAAMMPDSPTGVGVYKARTVEQALVDSALADDKSLVDLLAEAIAGNAASHRVKLVGSTSRKPPDADLGDVYRNAWVDELHGR